MRYLKNSELHALANTWSDPRGFLHDNAVLLCAHAGPVPGPILDFALALLRELPIESADDSTFAFTLDGFLAWIEGSNPGDGDIAAILNDIAEVMPVCGGSRFTYSGAIPPDGWVNGLKYIAANQPERADACKRALRAQGVELELV